MLCISWRWDADNATEGGAKGAGRAIANPLSDFLKPQIASMQQKVLCKAHAPGDQIFPAGPIDVLVNNAGIGWMNAFEGTPMDLAKELFETNTIGLMRITQTVLPHMRENGGGGVINISSSVTLRSLPLLSVYTATKAAVNAFDASLSIELEPFGISDALKGQALFGIMSVFLYLGGFALAIEQKVPTGLVALIADLLPLAIAALSQPVLGERLTARQWQGTAIAVAGVLIVSLDSLSFGTAPAWAYGLTIASMLIFAGASVLYRRRKTPHMPVHQSLCIHMLTGSVLFGLCARTQGSLVPPISSEFAIGMAWLVFIATYLAYTVYYTSLRLFPAAKVSAAIYLSPPVTMLWAWILFSEPLTLTMVTGLAVTLGGVWMTCRD